MVEKPAPSPPPSGRRRNMTETFGAEERTERCSSWPSTVTPELAHVLAVRAMAAYAARIPFSRISTGAIAPPPSPDVTKMVVTHFPAVMSACTSGFRKRRSSSWWATMLTTPPVQPVTAETLVCIANGTRAAPSKPSRPSNTLLAFSRSGRWDAEGPVWPVIWFGRTRHCMSDLIPMTCTS